MYQLEKKALEVAGNEVFRQLAEEPNLFIALDPKLADFLGAFEEKALCEENL